MTLPQLTYLGDLQRDGWGSKAANLAAAASAGFPVPPGFVVTEAAFEQLGDQLGGAIEQAATANGSGPFAVRSSGSSEDLADASYAGLYETVLNVETVDLGDAVRRVFASARSERIAAYESPRATGSPSRMAVLVQKMIEPVAAGVAFTANPISGRRDETIITAVAGLAEPLVSGDAIGEQWIVRDGEATREGGPDVLAQTDAIAVAELARQAESLFGVPQDIEWAIDQHGELFLLQARPMTALPEAANWTPPGPGLWFRNFRLGEWLPEAMTPLFAEWVVPLLEAGYLEGMWSTARVRVPFRYAAVNGWYYNATPTPSAHTIWRVLVDSRGRGPWFLYNVLARVSSNPPGADRAVLRALETEWREQILPAYRECVNTTEPPTTVADAIEIVDRVCSLAGHYLWSLAVVGGSAWKMEGALEGFWASHLAARLRGTALGESGAQVLLRGLIPAEPDVPTHSVYSLDWYFPTSGEGDPARPLPPSLVALAHTRSSSLVAARIEAEAAARSILEDRPRLRARFDSLVAVAQRYAVLREEQSRDLTLAWPLLRRCALRLGQELADANTIAAPDDVFFVTISEVRDTGSDHRAQVETRRARWESQRRLDAPLTLGTPPRLIGDPIARAVDRVRNASTVADGAIVGHPASVGRATGQVRVVSGPDDFPNFLAGEILVAKATAPAWTQLFPLAAAVVTDGGTLAAHASLIAREYGIPAVVGTGDATIRLHTGQVVTVDGGAGTVTPSPD